MAAGVEGSFCGGMGGAPSAPGSVASPPAPRGPSGSSSTACSLVGCATRRRGVRREGRGPEAVLAVGAVSVGLLGVSSPAVAVSEVEDGGWAGVSAQGDSPKGSMFTFPCLFSRVTTGQ